MKLADLEPEFLKNNPQDPYTHHMVATLAEANGIMFLCPKCFQENKDGRGVHRVICWDPSVSQDVSPKPGRWEMKGSGVDDLTLVAGSSSVLLNGGCKAHFFIRNGEIVFT